MRTCRLAFIATLLGGAIATAQPGTGPADSTSLKSTHDRYASIHSISMKATGRIRVAFKKGDSPALANFTIAYWADGTNFRLNYRSNAVRGLIGTVQIAKDGETWQELDETSAILSYTTRDVKQTAVAGPNPFFLPVLFLSPDSDQCPLCDIRLRDLRESGQWQAARLSGPGASPSPSTVVVGPQSLRDPWTYHVTLSRVGNSVVPLVVQRIDRSGRVLAEVESKDFRDFGNQVGMMPTTIETKSFTEDGTVDSQGTWNITDLQINVAIDPLLFRLSQDDAQIVIDDDTGMFLKHPQREMVGHSMKEFSHK